MIITLSRQAATNGGLIGRLTAERLGLRVYDAELVDEIARRMHVDPHILACFDEAIVNPVQDVLEEWLNSVNECIYHRYLRDAFYRISREGKALIIGRGANFVLSGPRCLRVRIVAPLALRIGIYRTIHPEVSEAEARQRINAEDRGKARFVRQLYHADINDPQHYDLVINLQTFSPDEAVEQILSAARTRLTRPQPCTDDALLPYHMRIITRHRRPSRSGMVEHYYFQP